MNDLDLEKIKQSISIVDLASQYGCNPYGNGNTVHTKYNCLRSEKTSSLKLYKDTNSWADFGSGDGGSIIDFVMKAENIEFKEAVTKITGHNFEAKEIKIKTYDNSESKMKPDIVEKCFNGVFHTNINLKKENHLQQLKTIAPEWVFKDSKKEDLDYFMSISKFIESRATTIHKLPNKDGISFTFKYRYYFNEEQNKMIKWYSLPNTTSSYLYCRLTGKDLVLVVEGSRDYLTALLCGFDVVSLYSKNYKFTDEDYLLLKGKKVIFIDDFGENAIKNIHDNFDGDKIYFNHNLMRNISKCESKDFSDYLYHFKSLEEFLNAFNEVTKNSGTWEDGLISCKSLLTKELLENTPDVESIVDKFIFKGTLTVIHSKAGQGKSSLILSLLKKAITENKIKKFIYFDADNPLSVLKNRISKLTETFNNQMIYHTHTMSSVDSLKTEMERLCTFKGQGKDVLIVVDTMGRFIDVMKDDQVKPFMDLGIRLRDNFGATIIFIHHSNKQEDSNENVIFRGSTVIHGDCDFMWGLKRTKNKILLRNDKGRFDYFEKIEATVDLSNYDVSISGKYELEEIQEENNEEIESVSIDEIINFSKDKGKIAISDIQKRFLHHKTKDKRDIIWNLICDNKNIFTIEKIGKGWFCECLNNQPTITEFDNTVYDDEALTSIFGD